MTGTSYNGTLPVAAATTGVEGLEAIIPVAPNTSYYHYYRSYGLVRHPGGWLGEDIDYLYDFIHTRADMPEYCNRGWTILALEEAGLLPAAALTTSQPLVPGQFVDLTFDLQPDVQIIPAGQQIGLMIMSSDRDFTLWPRPGTRLSVDLDATSIVIPVVGGAMH